MQKLRIAINGFGRMGRLAVRALRHQPGLQLVHVNEHKGGVETAAHLLEFDSVHGRYQGTVAADGEMLTVDGSPVYLSDVADVEIGGAIRQGLQTLNGEREVVSGMVVQLYGANTSQVIERVEEKLEQIKQGLPEGVEIVPYYEQKTLVANSVATVTNALIQGIVLVALVLLLFMGGFRASVVVALAIPFS